MGCLSWSNERGRLRRSNEIASTNLYGVLHIEREETSRRKRASVLSASSHKGVRAAKKSKREAKRDEAHTSAQRKDEELETTCCTVELLRCDASRRPPFGITAQRVVRNQAGRLS